MKIIAHRGASASAPENTLAAVRLAAALGAAGVEVDARLTRDGQLAVLHDATTRRTAPGQRSLRASRSTLAELQTRDAGLWKNPRFAGERIPALGEVLAALDPKQEIFIELKSRASAGILAALDHLLAPPAKNGFPAARAVVMGFHGALIRKIKRQRPAWRVLLLLNRQPTARAFGKILSAVRARFMDGLGQNRTWTLKDEDYAALRAAGAILSVWTVDDAAEARVWRARGFHYLTTNDPARICSSTTVSGRPGAQSARNATKPPRCRS